MEVTPRRSRMRASPFGRRLELTARDFAIFALLERYRYLRSTYLHAFVGGASETRFKERLGLLFHEGYIGRPVQQWEFAGCRHRPAVYEAAKGSKRALDERGSAPASSATFLAADGAHRQFLHSLLICDLLASIELATKASNGLRFVSWGEILARAPETTRVSVTPFRLTLGQGSGGIIPDGIFGLEYVRENKKSYRFFALEADRGTMPVIRSNPRLTSMSSKLQAYESCIGRNASQRCWNIPNLLVLIVTTEQVRARSVLESIARARLDCRRYLVASVDSLGDATQPTWRALAGPWRRAELGEIDIRQSEWRGSAS